MHLKQIGISDCIISAIYSSVAFKTTLFTNTIYYFLTEFYVKAVMNINRFLHKFGGKIVIKCMMSLYKTLKMYTSGITRVLVLL